MLYGHKQRRNQMAKADAPHLRLRIEQSLLAKLEKAAAKNDRPLTAEITARLAASFIEQETLEKLLAMAENSEVPMTIKFGGKVFKNNVKSRLGKIEVSGDEQ
jgi:hypothetical protein